MAMRTPSRDISLTTRSIPASLPIRLCSVISRTSRRAGNPLFNKADATSAGNRRSWNCRPDTFTATGSSGTLPTRRHEAICSQTCVRTVFVSASISPRLKAEPMNASGSNTPRVGCVQRTSASSPTTSPVASAICG